MFLTNVLFKKAKSKYIMVIIESAVSGHQKTRIRDRLADKMESIEFDPYIQQESLYKECKKIRSMKSTWKPTVYKQI
ncbi:large ribosomal subunit protein bL33m [Bombyx mori]|uniref:39S ribosomal protein L33, mitochondrial n=1 Tax=Bombyx mori TaxID=7091 RepID=A0A8R2ALW5_BOMMO|nr:39S ribosomal protein L33, mitochondrial isoform X1 [Bombyx mori]